MNTLNYLSFSEHHETRQLSICVPSHTRNYIPESNTFSSFFSSMRESHPQIISQLIIFRCSLHLNEGKLNLDKDVKIRPGTICRSSEGSQQQIHIVSERTNSELLTTSSALSSQKSIVNIVLILMEIVRSVLKF